MGGPAQRSDCDRRPVVSESAPTSSIGTGVAPNAWATGCGVLFALPFCGAGLFAFSLVVRAWGHQDGKQLLLLSVFALIFTGAGFGLLMMIRLGRRRFVLDQALRQGFPTEPWRWRPEWQSNRIGAQIKSRLIGAWVFAGVWNLVSAPVLFVVAPQIAAKGWWPAGIAFAFPVIGAVLLVSAIRETLRMYRFGGSVVQLTTFPGQVGGVVDGTVELIEGVRPAGGFHVRLTAVRRQTSSSGRESNTRESVEWQEELTLAPLQNPTRTELPFSFRIPADAPETDPTTSNNTVNWRLEVTAEVPGVDYSAVFELPVFRPPGGSTATLPTGPSVGALASPGYRPPPNSSIRWAETPSGCVIDFPAGRNPGVAWSLTCFWALWTAMVVVLWISHVPWLFKIAFSLSDALILTMVASLWFIARRAEIDHGALRITTTILGWTRTKVVDLAAVKQVQVSIGMQSGTTAYHDVSILGQANDRATLGTGIRDRREAEWLAAKIRVAVQGGRS